MGDFSNDEKIIYSLKYALNLTTKDPTAAPGFEFLSAPRIFPSSIPTKDLLKVGEGDINSEGKNSGGGLVDLTAPYDTVKLYKIIDPITNKVSNKNINDILGTSFTSIKQVYNGASETIPDASTFSTGTVYRYWFHDYNTSPNDGTTEPAFNWKGLRLAYAKSTPGDVVLEDNDNYVPHIGLYLGVPLLPIPGSSWSSGTGDSISYEHSKEKGRYLLGLLGLSNTFKTRILKNDYNTIKVDTASANEGDTWFTNPTYGLLSFYGIKDTLAGKQSGIGVAPSECPRLSFCRYIGESVDFSNIGSGGGGGASVTVGESNEDAPTDSVSKGDLFFDIDDDTLKINKDGTANGWVGVVGRGFSIDADGNVGIGTDSPAQKLNIHSWYGGSPLYETDGINFSTDNNGPRALIHSAHNISWSTGYIGGYIGAGENNATGQYPGGLVFKTKALNSSPPSGVDNTLTTRMVIDSNGKVGIGTIKPQEKLEVAGNILLYDGTWTNGSYSKIIGDNTGARKAIWWNYDNSPSGTQIRDNHSIGFYTKGDTATDHILRMIVNSSGYVGIGTNSLGGQLHIKNHWPTQTNTLFLESDYPGRTGYQSSKVKIKMTSVASGGGQMSSYISQGRGGSVSGHEYYIGMGGDSNGYALAVTNGGRVGIGTHSPRATLNVTNNLPSGNSTAIPSTYGGNSTTTCVLGHGVTGGTQNYWGLNIGTLYSGKSYFQGCSTNGTSFYDLLLNPQGGNVGIGTNNPQEKLQVAGNILLYDGTWTYGSYSKIIGDSTSARKAIWWNYDNSPSGTQIRDNHSIGFYTGGNTGTDHTLRMIVNSSGEVGIRGEFRIYNQFHGSYYSGSNYYQSIIYLGGNAYSPQIRAKRRTGYSDKTDLEFWVSGVNQAAHHAMTIQGYGDGRVGIGTTGPTHPLHVHGWVKRTETFQGTYVSQPATYYAGYTSSSGSWSWRSDSNTNNNAMTIKASNGILAMTGFWTKSDERVKKNITEINDYSSLEKVRDISCVSYNYKDVISRGSSLQVGFIAQQVLKHFPHAISYDTDFIPDKLEKITDASWNETKLFSESLVDVSGVKYRFYVHDISDNIVETELDIVGNPDNSFTFEKKWDYVFCFGKQVNDLHILDKNKLFALNFSATQEIDRIQQQQLLDISGNTIGIEVNKNELELLKLENQELTNKVTSLETELNNLKTIVESLVNNN